MARPFKSRDVDAISAWHAERLKSLEKLTADDEAGIDEVRSYAQTMYRAEVNAQLEKIPVERLGAQRKGLRVSTLRSRGYETVADVLEEPYSFVLDRRSPKSVRDAWWEAKGIRKRIEEHASISLSADNRTYAATGLVRESVRHFGRRKLAVEARRLLTENARSIERDLAIIRRVAGFFSWLFASKAAKREAAEAYERLYDLEYGDYASEVDLVFQESADLESIDDSAAWAAFERDPTPFIGLVEEVAPEVLAGATGDFGLPESLAAEVEAEPLLLDGFTASLRRYQQWGVKFALHQGRVLLGDDMGLGKTVEAIAAMVSLSNGGGTHFMVVCPLSVLENWSREIGKWWPVARVFRLHGSREARSGLRLWAKHGGVAVTNYETLNGVEVPGDVPLSLLVVDEAHWVKSPGAKRTRSVRKVGGRSERVLYMTGTALENKVDEMVSLIGALDPEVAESVRGMEDISDAPEFRNAVATVYMRRKRDEVLGELPERIDVDDWLIMGDEERRAYEDSLFTNNFMAIRRLSWNYPNLADSCKAVRLGEIVEEAESEGRRLIICSYFRKTISSIVAMLGDKAIGPLWGDTGIMERQEMIDRLGEAPPGTALVTQIDAGGLGLNVQAASVVVICEPQYKPSTVNQAIARAHRMGQARSVIVHRLLCERTIEERMMHRLREKQEVFDAFADKSEAADEVGELDGGNMAEFVREERERVERERGMTENAEEGNRSDQSASKEDRKSPNGAEVRKPRHLAPLPEVEIDDVKSGDDVGGEERPELPG